MTRRTTALPDGDQHQTWIAVAKVLLGLPGALEAQLLRDSDLTLLGYLILSRLAHAEEESLRMSQIASMANGSLPRISHAVARLEDRGWVTRAVIGRGKGQGRRHTVATLTDAGRAHLIGATPAHAAMLRRLVVEPLGERFATFGSLAELIVEALGELTPGPDRPGAPGDRSRHSSSSGGR